MLTMFDMTFAEFYESKLVSDKYEIWKDINETDKNMAEFIKEINRFGKPKILSLDLGNGKRYKT